MFDSIEYLNHVGMLQRCQNRSLSHNTLMLVIRRRISQDCIEGNGPVQAMLASAIIDTQTVPAKLAQDVVTRESVRVVIIPCRCRYTHRVSRCGCRTNGCS